MSKPFDKTKPFVVRPSPVLAFAVTQGSSPAPDRKARILSDDLKSCHYYNGEYKVSDRLVVAVEGNMYDQSYEHLMIFEQNGKSECGTYRLVNVPVKKTGWVNVYVNPTTREVYTDKVNYTTEEWAKTNARVGWAQATGLIVNTVKVEWEE